MMCDSRFDPVIRVMGLALIHPTFTVASLLAKHESYMPQFQQQNKRELFKLN